MFISRFSELLVPETRLACEAARHEAPLIAHDLGLRYRKSLAAMDLANLTDAVDTKGVATNDLRSFHRADWSSRPPIARETSVTSLRKHLARSIHVPAGAHRQSRRPWLLDSSTVIVR